MNAFRDVLGHAANAADNLFLGGAVGQTRRRNAFADQLEAGNFNEAANLAVRAGEPAYAQFAQQQGAAQASAQQAAQDEENVLFSSLAIGLSEITDPQARTAAFEAMKPGLSQRFGLDDEDYAQVPLNDANALRLFGQQMIAPQDQVQNRQSDFSNRTARMDAETNRMKALKPSSPLVSVNTGATESEFAKQLGKVQGAQYGDIQTAAISAQQQIQQAESLMLLLDEGVRTGRIESLSLPARQLAASLGIEVEGVPEQETFRALTNQLALRLRNPDSGMGLTGNTSNMDVRFLKESVPGLEKTPEGNRLLLELFLQVQRRKIVEANLAEQYAERNGSLTGFQQYMTEYNEQNPIFDDELRTRVGEIVGGAGAAGQDVQVESSQGRINFKRLD